MDLIGSTCTASPWFAAFVLRCFSNPALLWRRKLKSKAKLESRMSYFRFKALSSRRFQLGFHRFNLHRLTLRAASLTRRPPKNSKLFSSSGIAIAKIPTRRVRPGGTDGRRTD